MPTTISTSKQKNIGLGAVLLAVLIIFVLTLASGTANTQTATKVQPALLAMAAEQPDTAVRVIIQKSDSTADVEYLVTDLEGTVIKDLHIINAIVAEMGAESAVDIAFDASVNWVSLDNRVVGSKKDPKLDPSMTSENFFLDTLNVRPVWDMGLTGEGIGVAVIDSGITNDQDFGDIGRTLSFNPDSTSVNDTFGHGTHVAGIIAGTGDNSNGIYQGIAPESLLLGLKISDENGMAYESDTVEAMQWVLDNKDTFNIRVVNLSINSSTEQSYHTSPMDAAAEILWFNGVVVVASSGNRSEDWSWDTVNTAPANDPFIITVGASNENGNADRSNDYMALFTANDITTDGFIKPDVMAPGKDIYSVLSNLSSWDVEYPDRCILDCQYFRLSGTSMAAPMVSGAVALLLQAEPNLTPDQVKYRLMNTGGIIYGDYSGSNGDFAYLDVYDLLTTPTTESANTGIAASQLLWTGDDPINWGSVNWGSVNWGSVNWGSVNWGSVNWGSVNWGSISWDD